MGGLGNQLFQVFTLIAYSLKHKRPFHFEILPIEREDRPFYWDNFLKRLKIFLKPSLRLPIYREQNFHFTEIPFINQPFKLLGYFQSYKYFDSNKEQIERLIELHSQRDMYKNEYNFDNMVSLHFRLGDYVNLQHHHPVMTIYYYKNAIRLLLDKTNKKDWTVLYFCEDNDIKTVKEKINKLKTTYPDLSFIKIDSKYTDWEQMLIMSLCQHNIIANSSFSWWGAYFNKNQNKVFYPSKWFGPSQGTKNLKDLCPEHWNKIME
tara:strand:- start:19379 stop:20167 length:789 start_codon:yes stop_codon:yes gene_type:complete